MPDPVLIPAILSLSFSGVIGIISQIQHSRCSEINCLGCSCKRKVPPDPDEHTHLTEIVSPRNQNNNID